MHLCPMARMDLSDTWVSPVISRSCRSGHALERDTRPVSVASKQNAMLRCWRGRDDRWEAEEENWRRRVSVTAGPQKERLRDTSVVEYDLRRFVSDWEESKSISPEVGNRRPFARLSVCSFLTLVVESLEEKGEEVTARWSRVL